MDLHGNRMDRTTQAAEGLVRRRFSVAELEAMVAAGIIDEDERIELIGGEVVPMSPKGDHHEILKHALIHYWAKRVPDHLTFTTETTFRLTSDTYLEPDFVFYDKAAGIKGLLPANRPFRRRDRGYQLRLRHRAQGGALCELRHLRALGRPRGAAGNAHPPHPLAHRLPIDDRPVFGSVSRQPSRRSWRLRFRSLS